MSSATTSSPGAAPAAETSSPATTRSSDRTPRSPEKKIGPFAGGVGVAVWLNQTETNDGGTRMFRSITVAPRRYFDKESNQWKDAPSYNPTDLPALIFALTQAQAYCYTTPLPGETHGEEGGEVPF